MKIKIMRSESSEDGGTQTSFSTTLTNMGFDKKHTEIGKFWAGLGLAGDDDA